MVRLLLPFNFPDPFSVRYLPNLHIANSPFQVFFPTTQVTVDAVGAVGAADTACTVSTAETTVTVGAASATGTVSALYAIGAVSTAETACAVGAAYTQYILRLVPYLRKLGDKLLLCHRQDFIFRFHSPPPFLRSIST